MSTTSEMDWKQEWCTLKEYACSLERDRAKLWEINEHLRDFQKRLEKGQEHLQDELNRAGVEISRLQSRVTELLDEIKRRPIQSLPPFSENYA